MDIKHLKIKKKVEKAYKKIKKFEKKLVDLREKCKHPKVKTANFMWASGHTTITKVCAICGKTYAYQSLENGGGFGYYINKF